MQRGESELEPICGRDDSDHDRQRLHEDPAQNADVAHGNDEPRANRSPDDRSGSTEDPCVAIQMTDLPTLSSGRRLEK